MSHILILETSGESCSVALADDNRVISYREINEVNSHAAHLTNLISEVLKDAEFPLKKINAVAVNGGPGSYTGLRVGISVAKGLCYSLPVPLIAVDGLTCLASAAIKRHTDKYAAYVAVMNSRLNELYISVYKYDNTRMSKSAAVTFNDPLIDRIKGFESVCLVGPGAEKFRSFDPHSNKFYIDNEIIMGANGLAEEAFARYQNNVFESLVDFEPFYLKPVHIRKKLE